MDKVRNLIKSKIKSPEVPVKRQAAKKTVTKPARTSAKDLRNVDPFKNQGSAMQQWKKSLQEGKIPE